MSQALSNLVKFTLFFKDNKTQGAKYAIRVHDDLSHGDKSCYLHSPRRFDSCLLLQSVEVCGGQTAAPPPPPPPPPPSWSGSSKRPDSMWKVKKLRVYSK